jgi:VWFA-related protein
MQITTRVIKVDVLVHDRNGNPVEDLKANEFHVYDDGELQRIEYFNTTSGSFSSTDANQLPETLPPNVFTNVADRSGNLPDNLTIILVDALNTPFGYQAYANEQLVKYLRQLKPNDHVAIYALGNGLHILHDFTTDDALLVRVAEAYKGEKTFQQSASEINERSPDLPFGPDVIASARDPNSPLHKVMQQMEDLNERVGQFYQDRRTETTIAAFRAIGLHVANIVGRKNLLWISGSFPIAIGVGNMIRQGGPVDGRVPEMNTDPRTPAAQTYGESLMETERILESADVAVYPVDATGLVAPFSVPTSPGAAMPSGSPGADMGYPDDAEAHAVMSQIADDTGGLAFFNTNDIAHALEQAKDDARFSYVLGYSPQIRWDGRFHKVKVRVDRPGVNVRVRKGYFALPAPSYAPRQARLLAYQTEVSPLDAVEIPLTVGIKVEQPKTPSRFNVLNATVFVAGKRVQFAQTPGRWEADLDYMIAQRDDRGKILIESDTGYRFRLGSAAYQAAMQGGLTYHNTFGLDPRATNLKIVIYDYRTHTFGSTTIPLDQIQGLHLASN